MKASRILLSALALGVVAVIAPATVSLTALAIAGWGASSPAGHRVRIIVDYNDGVQKHFTAIHWRKDMTVFDAMNQAKSSPHGIVFEYKGSGQTALLTRIDDLESEGGGADHKNWLYWVNTEFADKSFGVQKLQPSDVVLWRYDAGKDQ